ncbi:hypothetical protein VPNG_08142 [Cytospora leucostoma]|uniref:Uncharacterized protein n=1 Tax=Cytospora leucostoma TaxID=1230097 RepID=A0A423WI94_9PEZI|nr:hypothetical protein VPNG_08142 [Cytospora leucostoma]
MPDVPVILCPATGAPQHTESGDLYRPLTHPIISSDLSEILQEGGQHVSTKASNGCSFSGCNATPGEVPW